MNTAHLKHKQVYFYVEDGKYSCVVAIYKINGIWKEGRIVYGKRPRKWGNAKFDTAIEAEELLNERYDYVEYCDGCRYEEYEALVNS